MSQADDIAAAKDLDPIVVNVTLETKGSVPYFWAHPGDRGKAERGPRYVIFRVPKGSDIVVVKAGAIVGGGIDVISNVGPGQSSGKYRSFSSVLRLTVRSDAKYHILVRNDEMECLAYGEDLNSAEWSHIVPTCEPTPSPGPKDQVPHPAPKILGGGR